MFKHYTTAQCQEEQRGSAVKTKASKMTIDLTTGSIWKKILLFAIPIFGISLLQLLYNTVDIYFAGNVIGKTASAAIGSSSMLITCLVGFFGGMSVGASVRISHAVGARDRQGIQNAVHTAVGLSLVGGVLILLAGEALAPWYLRAIRTPEAIFPEALLYLRIYFYSIFSVLLYNMTAGIIRAMGNSAFPLIVQAIGGVTHAAMDVLFLHFSKSVASVAWATMICQSVAALLCVWFLMRCGGDCTLHLRRIRIRKDDLLEILCIGVPAGLQTLVIALSNVIAQAYINGLGVDAISAFTYYYRIELMIYFPITAFGQTMTVFAGQNLGADNVARMKKGLVVTMGLALAVVLLASGVLLALGEKAFLFFDRDADVASLGRRIIWITFPFYWLYIILQVVGDTIRGAGKTLPPMLIIMANICLLRTACIAIFVSIFGDVRGVAISYPISWFTTDVCMLLYYRFGRWLPKKQKDTSTQTA